MDKVKRILLEHALYKVVNADIDMNKDSHNDTK
jgi:hypothetical protein